MKRHTSDCQWKCEKVRTLRVSLSQKKKTKLLFGSPSRKEASTGKPDQTNTSHVHPRCSQIPRSVDVLVNVLLMFSSAFSSCIQLRSSESEKNVSEKISPCEQWVGCGGDSDCSPPVFVTGSLLRGFRFHVFGMLSSVVCLATWIHAGIGSDAEECEWWSTKKFN